MGDHEHEDGDDRATSGHGATWVAPAPEGPRQQRHTMIVPNPVIAMDDEATPPPTALPPEQTIRDDHSHLPTNPSPEVDPYREPPVRFAEFFPTGQELRPIVREVKGLLRAALYHLRRAGRFLRERVYGPARDVALEKLRALTDQSPPDKTIDNYTDTFSRKRAKKWQKFHDGKKSSSCLQDDDTE